MNVFVAKRDGDWIAPLPDATVQDITWVLNSAGSASFTVPPLGRGVERIKLVANEIQIFDEGDLIWWGVPWRASGGPATLTFGCEGLLSLFTKRFVDDMTLEYTSIDQHAIAWSLLAYAQSEATQPNRDFNIDAANFGPSGRIRSRRYSRNDHAMILDLLKEFPTLEDGFDYDIITTRDGGRFWTPYYPQKGSLKKKFPFFFKEGDPKRNIISLGFNEDALNIATHVYVTGGSEKDVKFEENVEDPAASAVYGVMQAILSDGQQKDVQWLEERAAKEVNSRKIPLKIPDITVSRFQERKAGRVDLLKSLFTGDSVPVRIDHGYIQINGNFRIQQLKWNRGDTLTFSFGEEV